MCLMCSLSWYVSDAALLYIRVTEQKRIDKIKSIFVPCKSVIKVRQFRSVQVRSIIALSLYLRCM